MGDVVNLNQYRKKRSRDRGAERAAENRAKYGRDKGEKTGQRRDVDKHEAELDGKNTARKPPSDKPPEAG